MIATPGLNETLVSVLKRQTLDKNTFLGIVSKEVVFSDGEGFEPRIY